MASNSIVVKILERQPVERLNNSKLCGTLKRVMIETLNENSKSIDVIFVVYLYKLFH